MKNISVAFMASPPKGGAVRERMGKTGDLGMASQAKGRDLFAMVLDNQARSQQKESTGGNLPPKTDFREGESMGEKGPLAEKKSRDTMEFDSQVQGVIGVIQGTSEEGNQNLMVNPVPLVLTYLSEESGSDQGVTLQKGEGNSLVLSQEESSTGKAYPVVTEEIGIPELGKRAFAPKSSLETPLESPLENGELSGEVPPMLGKELGKKAGMEEAAAKGLPFNQEPLADTGGRPSLVLNHISSWEGQLSQQAGGEGLPVYEKGQEANPTEEGVVKVLFPEGNSEEPAMNGTDNNLTSMAFPLNEGETRGVKGHQELSPSMPQKEQFFTQLVEKAHMVLKDGQSEMHLQLKPDHLGKLSLHVSVEEGLVTARFAAESQQVKQLIESNLSQLKQSLQEQGLKFDRLSVSVGGQEAGGYEGSRQHQSWEHSRQGYFGRSGERRGLLEIYGEGRELAREWRDYGLDRGAIDYWA